MYERSLGRWPSVSFWSVFQISVTYDNTLNRESFTITKYSYISQLQNVGKVAVYCAVSQETVKSTARLIFMDHINL